jgi:hypothetical protein
MGRRGPDLTVAGSAGACELHRASRVYRGSGPSIDGKKGGSTMAGGKRPGTALAEATLEVYERHAER